MEYPGQLLPALPVVLSNIPREGYNITRDGLESLPRGLRESYCGKFYIEFLPIRQEPHLVAQYPNHAIIKIDFAERFCEYEGVCIDIAADFDGSVTKADLSFKRHVPGKMLVMPLFYREASQDTARTFQFFPPPWTDLRRLENLIATITRCGLQHFDFFDKGEMRLFLRGCRDFVYQTFLQLVFAGYIDNRIVMTWPIDIPLLHGARTVSDIMGKRFGERGDVLKHPIRRGRFRIYQRQVRGELQYESDNRE
ncbi:hypothetical protein F4781DRAFT_445643 [Annulohypoxylon bovei var. microspora]|nr:hypothetical protein F4781DRAFT_445643 [Annulohypoxylon bovei var. microspora]